MYRLTYRSTLSDDIGWTQIVEIAQQSRTNNALNSLDGLLLFSDNYVLQVLEGELEALNNIYFKILHDPRHSNIQLLEFVQVNQNLFSKWKMKEVHLARLGNPIKNYIKGFISEAEGQTPFPSDPDAALALLNIISSCTSES